ncbi:MAG TPA: transporter substrate-binding domain-containing protein [Micromonospora sp.]|nr:transporter substrate-binding domain-containing protein [Micromonospora sp.]
MYLDQSQNSRAPLSATGGASTRRGRRRWAGAVLALATGVAVAACGSAGPSPGGSQAKEGAPALVAEKGKFVACVDPTVPPMEFFGENDSRNPIGFDIDMIKAVADAWGVEPDVKVSSFTGLLPALGGGTCDVVWSAIFMLPERLQGEFDAVPYLNSGPVILVKGGNPEGISSPEDLSGKTVAVQSGTNFPGMLADLNKELEKNGKAPAKVQEYSGANEAAQQVVIGRAAAFLALDADGSSRTQNGTQDWEIAYTYPKELQYGVFYRKTDTELGEALRTEIKTLVEDGQMKAALERWKLPTDALVTP